MDYVSEWYVILNEGIYTTNEFIQIFDKFFDLYCDM